MTEPSPIETAYRTAGDPGPEASPPAPRPILDRVAEFVRDAMSASRLTPHSVVAMCSFDVREFALAASQMTRAGSIEHVHPGATRFSCEGVALFADDNLQRGEFMLREIVPPSGPKLERLIMLRARYARKSHETKLELMDACKRAASESHARAALEFAQALESIARADVALTHANYEPTLEIG